MRGHVAGLATPHPLGPTLPSIYQDDDFAQRFLAALDQVVAPIYSTLDNFETYLDPYLTPDDFLPWLAGWVGIGLDESWDDARRRAIVARAAELYRMRGTAAGLAAQVELQTGGTVEIMENGATSWSVDPGGELPGSPGADGGGSGDRARPKGDRHGKARCGGRVRQAGPRAPPHRAGQGRRGREGMTDRASRAPAMPQPVYPLRDPHRTPGGRA